MSSTNSKTMRYHANLKRKVAISKNYNIHLKPDNFNQTKTPYTLSNVNCNIKMVPFLITISHQI